MMRSTRNKRRTKAEWPKTKLTTKDLPLAGNPTSTITRRLESLVNVRLWKTKVENKKISKGMLKNSLFGIVL